MSNLTKRAKQAAKRVVSGAAYRLRLWKLLYFVLGLSKKKLLIVATFHRITDAESVSNFPLEYDRGLETRLFRLHLEVLSQYFDVIDQSSFLDLISGRGRIRRHSVLLTFDDADSEFTKLALPILKEFGFPAVMFVPTGYVETDRRFWHLRVSNIFHSLDQDGWKRICASATELPDPIQTIISSFDQPDDEAKSEVCRRIVSTLDRMDSVTISQAVDVLERSTACDYEIGIRCMSWTELARIRDDGIAVESHSVTHRKMHGLEADEIRRELRDSKSELEVRLGSEVMTFCYPAGSFDDTVVRIAEQEGYKAAFTTKPGYCAYPSDNRFRLPRFTIQGDDRPSTHFWMGKCALQYISSVVFR